MTMKIHWWKRLMHALGACDAPVWSWDPPPKCPCCRAETAYAEWDKLGLGYVNKKR